MTDSTLPTLALRPPAHRVSGRAVVYWTARAALGWVGLVAAQAIWLAVSPAERAAHVAVFAVTLVLAVLHLAVMPQWRFRVHRWEYSQDAVYTQAGWFNQERRIAPVSRIQTVDSHRGPFERMFGLANVTVTTASAAGPLTIEGLDQPVADRLVDDLTRQTQLAGGDAT